MNCPTRIVMTILVLIGMQGSVQAQPAKGQSVKTIKEATKQSQSLKIFRLRHMDTSLAYEIIGGLAPSGLRIAADKKTNSIVVQGTQENLDWIDALLARLDIEPEDSNAFKIFNLDSKGADYAQLLTQLLPDPSTKLAITDQGNGLVVMTEDLKRMQQIENLIKALVQSENTVEQAIENKNCRVRVTWLVDGADLSEPLKGSKPSKTLGEVCDYFEQSRDFLLKTATVAESVIQLTDQSKKPASLSTTSSSKIDNTEFVVRLQSSVAELEDGKVQLALDLQLNKSNSVSTMLAVPMNHPVAFSVTDVEGVSSVIVLEVEPIE